MNTQKYWILFVRPVGSSCWTVERIATTPERAYQHRIEALNDKLPFGDGSVHLQSTATVVCNLPANVDTKQAAYSTYGSDGKLLRITT